jgi:hypothetical protein
MIPIGSLDLWFESFSKIESTGYRGSKGCLHSKNVERASNRLRNIQANGFVLQCDKDKGY